MPDQNGPEPREITGRIVRVLDEHGRPTQFVGRVTMMRKRPAGVVCDVAGSQRRLEVPVQQIVLESEVTTLPSLSRKNAENNRDIDDVRMELDRTVCVRRQSVEALDIGDPNGADVLPFPEVAQR